MKRKILYIVGNLQSGGVSKSLVNQLNAVDTEKYNITLFIASKRDDVFSKYVPSNIQILYDERIDDLVSGMEGLKSLVKKKQVCLTFLSLIRMFLSFFSKSYSGLWLAKIMPQITTSQYDLIIDYNGQHQLYYMVNKLKGNRKITFFHNDYAQWPYYYKADKLYYPRQGVNHIFTVSPTCVTSMIHWFPSCKDKISVCENIESPTIITKLSQEPNEQLENLIQQCKQDGRRILLSVGHVNYIKGIDLALKAACNLKKEGIKFTWLFIGKLDEPIRVDEAKRMGIDS